MQEDMHFYGTYVLARAAGIPSREAQTVAYAAQFVDVSHTTENQIHRDGGLLHSTATVHNYWEIFQNSRSDPEEQRRVWVPFHFLPGGRGDTFRERILCVKNSEIANLMIAHHIEKAVGNCNFSLELLGVAAHVYMDTFSHYGFSGISSNLSAVNGESCVPIGVKSTFINSYVMDKKASFYEKYLPFELTRV